MDHSDRLARLGDLTVGVGLNMQPGQIVVILAFPEHAPLAREIARAAYRAGARRVDSFYVDRHFAKAHVELGSPETLGEMPPPHRAMQKMLEEEECAFVQISGEPDPDLFAGLDGRLVAKSRPAEFFAVWGRLVGERKVNWTIVPYATEAWARQVFGEPDVEALWAAIERAIRLDRPDPVAEWKRHVKRLDAIAAALNARRFDELHYRGPGTDFTVGLLPSSRWDAAETTTTFGVRHVANIPTEEIYTSPDKRRAEGKLRSTRPLELRGSVVLDLEFEFHEGRIIQARASKGADLIEGELATDGGAARLGEVSLVDGSSAVGQQGMTFYNTLFDENATCHIAYGDGFEYAVDDATDRAEGLNQSAVHTDFMVGGPEVEVSGRERGGDWAPIIRDNEFQIA